ncbi:MAG TPA: hypothetical protein VFZ70_01280 [Euzebyales bacterium]
MDLRPSRVAADGDGWTWLAADRRGARLRMTFWSTVLSVLLIVLAGAATLPPLPVAVPLVAAVLGTGLWLGTTLWNRAHSAVAVSALGVAVRSGFDTAQIAWRALHGVVAEPVGSRVRIVVEAQDTRHRTAATFTRAVALDWLARCEQEAVHRQMHPRPLLDGTGFRTSASPTVGGGV